jgi:uncharacterized protein YndB with AHSA1/START domain
MKVLIVNKNISINASAEKVWEAITNPELTKKYMYNSEVISEWKEGSTIIWRDAGSRKVHVKGIIKEIRPGKLLQTIDLSLDSGLPDVESNYSRVTYELKNDNGKTLLIVTEDNLNGDEERFNDSKNFWDVVLKGLKELVEK